MGRPIQKKFFGNTNPPDYGIGGEAVASVTVGGTNNDYSAFPTITFAAPTLPGGTTATGTVRAGVVSVSVADAGTGYTVGDVLTIVGGTGTAATLTVTAITGLDPTGPIDTVSVTTAGDYSALADLTDLAVTGGTGSDAEVTITALKINSVVVTSGGSGYTSAPTITDTPDGNATLTAVLAAVKQNAITISAYVPGGSSAVVGDIVKQTASRAYRVITAQGTGRCDLVAAAPGEGEMTMTAVDSDGGTYYVTKLTARRALIVKGDRSGTQFTTGASGISIPWTLDAAVENQTVQILNA